MEGFEHEKESGLAGEESRTDDDLRAPDKRRRRRLKTRHRLLLVFLWPFLLVFLFAAGGYFAIESGYLDKPLRTVALRVLDEAVGDGFDLSMKKTVLRFNASAHLVLEARGVSLAEKGKSDAFIAAEKTRIELNFSSALSGKPSVDDITVSGVSVDYSKLKSGNAPVALRVDALPTLFQYVFDGVSRLSDAAKAANADRFTLTGLEVVLPAMQKRTAQLRVEDIEFVQSDDGSIKLAGQVDVAGRLAELSGDATTGDEGVEAINLSVNGFNVSPFLSKWTRSGEPHLGLYGVADLAVRLRKATAIDPLPEMSFSVTLPDTAFYGDGLPAQIRKGQLNGHYDFTADKLEIDKSVLEFPGAYLPFSGGFIDADRLNKDGISHIAAELLIEQASSRTRSMQETPITFSAKFLGDLDLGARRISSNNVVVRTADGVLGGSVAVDFGKPLDPRFDGDSPEISLALYSDRVSTSTFKQLWPFWLAYPVRVWAGQNLFGGTVSDLSLALYLPRGRLPIYPDPVRFDENELKIDFAMERGRINIAGDIPPLRDTKGKLHYAGDKLDVEIESGAAYFPSGRVVDLKGGSLKIPDVYDPQLITDVDMRIAGPADAAAELATYRPIQVLDRVGFAPEDFSGYVNATVSAHFPLKVSEETKGEAEWKAQLALDNVAISKPIGGKAISAISGELSVDPNSAVLDADLSVGGVALQISMVEPLIKDAGVKRKRTLSGILNKTDLAKLVPGLDELFDGQIKVRVELKDDDRQIVDADLEKAEVSIPWAGWTKGVGVPASISFETRKNGEEFEISDFKFAGEGFGATGSLVSGANGLVSADFSHVQLAPGDSVALSARRAGRGYSLTIKGKSADLRGVLTKIKSGGSGDGGRLPDIKVVAKLDTAIGFNSELMKNVDFSFVSSGGEPANVNLSAVTGGGDAVIISTTKDQDSGKTIEISSTDAGAFARFTGLYTYMYGGLLNQKLRYTGKGNWVGSVDVRRFDIVNESRFEELVTTRSGSGGKSLNDAVRKNIDLKAQHFSRANALLSIKDGVFSISRGVLRGEQVGATLQGVVRDKGGNMSLTGTFMPAYGLNRLFAELPLIGILLGNGRDKGLIGITFKLTGPIQKPKLQINPLSLIAPGVFRSIFEFQ